MSSIYNDQNIDFCVLTLKSTTGGGDYTLHAGTEFFSANELYSGSPVIAPLLVEPPEVNIAVGDHIGIRQNVRLRFYANEPIDTLYEGMKDLRASYQFYRAEIEIYYGARPTLTQTVIGDYKRRQVVEVLNASWTEDFIELSCTDIWFNDEEISQRIPDESAFADMPEEYIGEYAAIPFGENVIINAPQFENTASSNSFKIFVGFHGGSSFPVSVVNEVYAENKTRDLSPESYIGITGPSNPVAGILMSAFGQTSGTDFHLGQFWRSLEIQPAADALLSSFTMDVTRVGTIPTGDGDLKIELFRGQNNATTGVTVPIGGPLLSESSDPQDLNTAGGAIKSIGFGDFMPLIANQRYVLVFSYSNNQNVTQYAQMSVANVVGKTHAALDRSTQNKGWAGQANIELGCGVFAFDASGTVTLETSTTTAFGSKTLIDDNIISTVRSPVTAKGNFKAGVDGIKDVGPTYEASANDLLDTPVCVASYVIGELVLGSTSDLDATSRASVRASQQADSLKVRTAIDSETYAIEFLTELCKQFRMILYRDAEDNKYKFYYPEPTSAEGSEDHAFTEPDLQDELKILDVRTDPAGRVFNDFSQRYDVNDLESPVDPQQLRKLGGDKFKSIEILNAATSTAGDAGRVSNMSDSEGLYGKRRVRFDLDLHADTASARSYQQYLADRFYLAQETYTVRVPRRYFYKDVELFNDASVRSTLIELEAGGFRHQSAPFTAGTDSRGATYGDHPEVAWAMGYAKGRVTGIQEQGADLLITFETDEGPGSF